MRSKVVATLSKVIPHDKFVGLQSVRAPAPVFFSQLLFSSSSTLTPAAAQFRTVAFSLNLVYPGHSALLQL
jgi:hypothetical protein